MDELNVFKAVLLGLLRGLTGLMPLSSRAHMLLLEKLSGAALSGDGAAPLLMALHAGVLAAILIACIKSVMSLIRHPIKGELKWVLLSALPLLAVSLLLQRTGWLEVIEKSAVTLLPFALLFTGVILFLAQRIAKNRRIANTAHDRPNFGDALSLGLMQLLSVFPGVSLVGMELSGSLSGGLKPKRAAEFVYLSCFPALLALYLPGFIRLMNRGAITQAVQAHGAMLLGGFLAAMLTGILAIKLTQLLMRREKLSWLTLYLALLAIVTISLSLAGKI
ncbi:MAG: undecaprenyl-diphosphate phosphatase [Clostridia bacterium]|nr:undecaprenyl-diphosphate phosphatase [Clostridia bacterium]